MDKRANKRIRHWVQDSPESVHYVLTGLMTAKNAEVIVKSLYTDATIVDDDDGKEDK